MGREDVLRAHWRVVPRHLVLIGPVLQAHEADLHCAFEL
jgi:hypothetical protein